MLETLKVIFLPPNFGTAVAYMIIGAVIGAMLGTLSSLKANRPRLIINSIGGGSNQQERIWNMRIENRPSFLGIRLHGETAKEVRAYIRIAKKDSEYFSIYWGPNYDMYVNIEAGQSQYLNLFHWEPGWNGFYILEKSRERIANFIKGEYYFILRFIDRLDRISEIKIKVKYDDTNLKNGPNLQIIPRKSIQYRFMLLRNGFQKIFHAFSFRKY
jgi:hypothetical protein